MSRLFVPSVIERSPRGERSYDIFSRLLMDRIVFLGTPVDDDVANIIIGQLLFLQAEDPSRDIYLYINSPGGSVTAGLAIYDTMQFISAPVNTMVMGEACSMGAFLLAAGATGRRSALPNSRIMIHQPSGGARGTAADIEVTAREIIFLKERLNTILAHHTGRTVDEIAAATERDKWMSPEEAVKFGLVDQVVKQMPPVAAPRR